MKKIFIVLFLIFSIYDVAFADDGDFRLVIQNMAGYQIHHMDITPIDKLPEVDILKKPLQHKESIDIYLKKDIKEDLVLWLMNDDYSYLSIVLGKGLDRFEKVEIQNNGSVKMVLK